jgi:hypothetical protein
LRAVQSLFSAGWAVTFSWEVTGIVFIPTDTADRGLAKLAFITELLVFVLATAPGTDLVVMSPSAHLLTSVLRNCYLRFNRKVGYHDD